MEWSLISSIDIDGDAHDEIMIYRRYGLFRSYQNREYGEIASILVTESYDARDGSFFAGVDLDHRTSVTPGP